MAPAEPRQDRWQSLVHAAFLVDESSCGKRSPPERLQALKTALNSLLEVFPAGIDPVEDFEAYAVRRFVLAVSGAIEER